MAVLEIELLFLIICFDNYKNGLTNIKTVIIIITKIK